MNEVRTAIKRCLLIDRIAEIEREIMKLREFGVDVVFTVDYDALEKIPDRSLPVEDVLKFAGNYSSPRLTDFLRGGEWTPDLEDRSSRLIA